MGKAPALADRKTQVSNDDTLGRRRYMDSWIASLAYIANFRPVRDSKQQQQKQERDVYTRGMTAKVDWLSSGLYRQGHTHAYTYMHLHIHEHTHIHTHTMLVTKFKYQ